MELSDRSNNGLSGRSNSRSNLPGSTIASRPTKRRLTGQTNGDHALLHRLRWAPSLLVLLAMATVGEALSPAVRLFLAAPVLYACFKFAAIAKQRARWDSLGLEARIWFLTVWPGMDLRPFAPETRTPDLQTAWLTRGLVGSTAGATLMAATVAFDLGDWLSGWLAVGALLLLVHFGWADILSTMLRLRGFPVRRLFNPPEKSKSLNDFWTRRWNVAFVEMDKVLFMPRLRRRFGAWAPVAMLVLSGLLHELALSYPAGAGWGLPLIYFGVHGLGMHFERTAWFRSQSPTFARWWTRILVLAPGGLVFHQPFRNALPLELINLLKGIS